jgi:hypothetical protein
MATAHNHIPKPWENTRNYPYAKKGLCFDGVSDSMPIAPLDETSFEELCSYTYNNGFDLASTKAQEFKKEKYCQQASEALRYKAYKGVTLMEIKPNLRIERL